MPAAQSRDLQTYCGAVIGEGKPTIWVINVTSSALRRCPLYTRLRKYHCNALSDAVDQKAINDTLGAGCDA